MIAETTFLSDFRRERERSMVGPAGVLNRSNGDGCRRSCAHGANPKGWQTVAGGRSGQRGNDHRDSGEWGQRTPEGCQIGPIPQPQGDGPP